MNDAAPAIEIYSSEWCGFCHRARRLLDSKGIAYVVHGVDGDATRRREMIERAGRHTVPQIFIGGRHVGGSDDLYALERVGELDRLLGTDRAGP